MRHWPDGPLVDAAWLAARIGDEDLCLLDCRFDLADTDAGERAYRTAHIPGAHYVHLDRDLSGPKGAHGGRHPLPTPAAFARTMGRLGVGEGTMVVAYDEDASMAPRVWWLLRHMGHDAVAVLDGGIAAWREAGGRLEGDVPAPRARRFTPKPRPDLVVDVAEVRRPAPGTVLLDARAPERYRGEVEPIDPRAGHIPGAVSAPFREALDARGRWLEEEEHRRRFDRLAPPGTQLVAYCGSGVTACATLLALEIAGRTGGRLYAGSFSDWASYPEHDVRVGDVP